LFCFVFSFLFLTSCFLQLLLWAYDLDKHQTMYNMCGRNKRMYERICIQIYIPYILESNPHLVFAIFLNEEKLVRASNPHLSFNRPLFTGRLFE
jgi:hypothetical protein